MTNVLYVPDIANNLFPIGAALDKGLENRSKKNACILTKNNQTVIYRHEKRQTIQAIYSHTNA